MVNEVIGSYEMLVIYSANYSVSHKIKISERLKSEKLDFKGQSSNLKHVEKIDD